MLTNSATREMMTIAKANNASYVTISESPVRMKEIHRHHSFQVNLKGATKKLFLSSNEKGATATVVVFLRVSPSREIPFLFYGVCRDLSRKSERTVRERGRPVVAPTVRSFSGNSFFVLKTKGKGCAPVLVMRAGL